jgi:hypothetical protein
LLVELVLEGGFDFVVERSRAPARIIKIISGSDKAPRDRLDFISI